MGRAATILKSCSTENGEETLHIFIFIFLKVATRVSQRHHGVTAAHWIRNEEEKRKDTSEKRHSAANGQFF